MLDELPPELPDDPPELPELPPEEGGEPDGLGNELDEDCCSGQPPMRNTAAAPTATSLPTESRRLRRSTCIVTPSFHARFERGPQTDCATRRLNGR